MCVCTQVRSSGRRVPAGTKPRLLPVAHTGRTNFSETDLLFYTQSPDYCHPEPLLGSAGTANRYDTGNGSVPIQLAQCRFPELAISNAKILIYFFQINYTEAYCGACYYWIGSDQSLKLRSLYCFYVLTLCVNLGLRADTRTNFFNERVVKVWNSLPPSIVIFLHWQHLEIPWTKSTLEYILNINAFSVRVPLMC